MRSIMYAIFNKSTNERIYTNCNRSKCEKILNELSKREEYEIRYRWYSI